MTAKFIRDTSAVSAVETLRDYRLYDGLGSALKKLYKGLNGYRAYKSY